MIKLLNNFPPDNIRQEFKINYISRFLVRLAGYFYLHFIIVTMIIRQGAFAKHFFIFAVVPGIIVQPVGSIEMFFPENRNFLSHILNYKNFSSAWLKQ